MNKNRPLNSGRVRSCVRLPLNTISEDVILRQPSLRSEKVRQPETRSKSMMNRLETCNSKSKDWRTNI